MAKGKVNVGREVELKSPDAAQLKGKLAVFLPSPEANVAIPLRTSKGVLITVDGGEIGNGAHVR